ncbi:molybdopterin biosynthesis MoaE protein [Methanocaldococcus infernus ME]|uniref:Molybdopterin biosynthesis MoaE protein n=1 Tax=Methanocaldococcus infernus (strain DSM 11812 / JCM 15783 / ME) TaxID=573063 RepID=D5VQM9_METIM|nr:molybdenum cofactor biosynthesis protein MoaE [Methanocaldococcus infernus]ADG12882.1 molybdopterin biosynthesis MoaE protein [Methanocaldococcus infernus ME]
MIFDNLEEYKKYIEKVKEELKGEYGFILNSSGYVRKYSVVDGRKIEVNSLDINVNLEILKNIGEEIKKKYNLLELAIYHNNGKLKVGEEIVDITIFSRHRHEAFEALKELINEIKKYH